MDIMSSCELLIHDLDVNIAQKEEMKTRSIDQNIVNSLQCEIDQLRTKRNYYSEYFRDEMMKRCFNGCCDGGCCNAGQCRNYC